MLGEAELCLLSGGYSLHPQVSSAGPGRAGTSAKGSFGLGYPIDLTAAAQLDFPCLTLNLQCRMLEQLLAGLLFKHGLAEIRAAEPCRCNQKRGQQAPGMKREVAAATETQGAVVLGTTEVLGPQEGPGRDEQCPICLGVQEPLWKSTPLALVVPYGHPEATAVDMLGPLLPTSCTPKHLAVLLSQGCSTWEPPSILGLGSWDFLLSWGPQGPWGCGIPRPELLQGPAVGLSISQATVESFYLFPHTPELV